MPCRTGSIRSRPALGSGLHHYTGFNWPMTSAPAADVAVPLWPSPAAPTAPSGWDVSNVGSTQGRRHGSAKQLHRAGVGMGGIDYDSYNGTTRAPDSRPSDGVCVVLTSHGVVHCPIARVRRHFHRLRE